MVIKTTDKFLRLSHKISPTMTLQGSKIAINTLWNTI